MSPSAQFQANRLAPLWDGMDRWRDGRSTSNRYAWHIHPRGTSNLAIAYTLAPGCNNDIGPTSFLAQLSALIARLRAPLRP